MRRLTAFASMLALCLSVQRTPSAQAQGLVWNLPEDGTWVRYEGETRQTLFRPDNPSGDVEMSWTRHLKISSVGTETADVDGESAPCRWIEFELKTGRSEEGVLDTGPVGLRVMKVLVPERALSTTVADGRVVDADGIPVSFLPMVKGYRKLGDGEVEPMTGRVFQVAPFLTLMPHFERVRPADDPNAPSETLLQDVETTKYQASVAVESPTARTTTQAEFWRSEDVPFGLAQWSVTMAVDRKDRSQTREEFQAVGRATERLKAAQSGRGAQPIIAEQ